MRGFMRAIGLGSLLKNHATSAAESATHSVKKRAPRSGNSRRTARGTLLAVDEIHLLKPDQAAVTRGRESSVIERPQFLFFCGSDNSAMTAAARRAGASTSVKTEFSFESARASLKTTNIETPMISHRMPVFFNPQHGMRPQFE